MWINQKLEDYLSGSEKNNSCKIILTDLKKVMFSSDKSYSSKQISKELLKVLLDFSLSAPIRQVISNENNTLSIYDDENNTSSKCHQIIMPIYHNHKLSGLLITFFSNTDFENNLNITKIIRVFTEKHIHGINLENITEIDNSSLLFSEHYLENITTLLESHTHILKTNENYLIHKQNLSTIIKDFQDKLSASDLEVFENILSNIYTLSDYEHALLYSLGIKYGIELSKI